MAISRERLQELINEGATIWSDVWDEEVYLNNKCHLEPYHNNSIPTEPVNDYVLWVYEDDEHINKYFISQLEENVKEAEWHLKYHATRTEELNLPTWKEFKDYNENISVSFVGEDWVVYELSNDIDIYHKPSILLTADGECFEEWKSTEENYIKACDLCLKLFNGN